MRFAFAHKLVTYLFAGLGLTALMLGTTFSPIEQLLLVGAFGASWFAEPPLLDRPGSSALSVRVGSRNLRFSTDPGTPVSGTSQPS
ncbi:MAG: hypothetical protein JRJ24_03360 [Deltaproteobacteria bacterium]|nr:hypothetical protein [Deltaproteobacteria bacterium]